MRNRKIPLYLELFITFFKLGLFTFGGGYAMIPLIEEIVVNKKKWISQGEILDILAIAESTPGPIAVNSATYIGFKLKGVWGAIIATLGLIIPSFVIIFLISLCYQEVMKWSVVIAMFKGIKIAVILLLFRAVIRLKKAVKLNVISISIFIAALAASLTLSLFNITIPMFSLILIAAGILIGVVIELIAKSKEVNK